MDKITADQKNGRPKERNNFEGGSPKDLISEILRLVEKQTMMLKNGPLSEEAATAYRDRAWKIRELLELLDKGD